MYLLVDLTIDRVELAEPADLKRFHVAVAHGGDVARVERVLAEQGVGRLDPDDEDRCWVSAATVRGLAEGRVGAGWRDAFDQMLAKAAERGWYDHDRDEIGAHVEWISGEGETGIDGAPA